MFVKQLKKSVNGEMINTYAWHPRGEVTAIVQLVHGMAEHMERYDATAQALTKAGFLVVGHTHLGHGDTAPIKGFFGESNGVQNLIGDIDALRHDVQGSYPSVPYFIVGHSMGSFLVRLYILEHSQGLAGAVLSGTGHYSASLAAMGSLLANLLIVLGKGTKPSNLIHKIVFGANNKQIKQPTTKSDWLSSDPNAVSLYESDEYCGFLFTAYGYRDLFAMLKQLADIKQLKRIEKNLPVYLFSGMDDPVGAYGNGISLVASELREAGLTNVQVRLYKNGRHEMFNEVQAADVYKDLIQWIYNHLA